MRRQLEDEFTERISPQFLRQSSTLELREHRARAGALSSGARIEHLLGEARQRECFSARDRGSAPPMFARGRCVVHGHRRPRGSPLGPRDRIAIGIEHGLSSSTAGAAFAAARADFERDFRAIRACAERGAGGVCDGLPVAIMSTSVATGEHLCFEKRPSLQESHPDALRVHWCRIFGTFLRCRAGKRTRR